jgi:hypothetical protein
VRGERHGMAVRGKYVEQEQAVPEWTFQIQGRKVGSCREDIVKISRC